MIAEFACVKVLSGYVRVSVLQFIFVFAFSRA